MPSTDHPLFLVKRADIPELGAYAHFHWLNSIGQNVNGYFLQLNAVDNFCFIHAITGSVNPGATCADNGGVAVQPGIDIATHLNLVASFPGF